LASPFAVRAVYEAAVAGLVVAFCDTRATAGDGGEALADFVLEEVAGDPEGSDWSYDGGDEDEYGDEDEDEKLEDEDALAHSHPASTPSPPERKATAHGSMYAAARAVGMPATWVELRHEIAHGAGPEAITEPSLKRLHACATEALEWLWSRSGAHGRGDAERPR
jgi:Las1-like